MPPTLSNSHSTNGSTVGEKDASLPGNEARETVPYQPKVFRDFIALIGRLFYDDSSIVLLDFFAREQKAFTESEMKDRLRWREALLHQKLHGLEKQLLVERVLEAERGSKSIQLWRIHSHVFVAVAWRLKSLEEALQEEVRKASNRNDFLCSNPKCARRVSLLDAAAGPRALEDDHPLCRLCGSLLTTADSEEAKQAVESKLKRAYVQFASLREALQRVRGMAVPEFTSSVTAEADSPEAQPALLLEASPKPAVSTPAPTSASSVNDSRAIPWFGDNAAPPATIVNSVTESTVQTPQESSTTRMVFGTAATPSLLKPAAFKLPNSFDSSAMRANKFPLIDDKVQAETPTPSEAYGQSPLKLGSAGSGVGASKPFSMSLKIKSTGEGRGSSAVGSSSVVSQSKDSVTGVKRKGLEIFGAAGKKIKF